MYKREAESTVLRLQTEAPWLEQVEALKTDTYWYVSAYDPKQRREIQFVHSSDVSEYLNAIECMGINEASTQ